MVALQALAHQALAHLSKNLKSDLKYGGRHDKDGCNGQGDAFSSKYPCN